MFKKLALTERRVAIGSAMPFKFRRKARNLGTFALVLAGPLLALATFLVLGPLDQRASSNALRFVLLLDLIYVLFVVAMILGRVAKIVAARKADSIGSRMHSRLAALFALIAFMPAVTVAVFAMLSVNMGLEVWFSTRVQSVVASSLSAARSYEEEHRRDMEDDIVSLADLLTIQRLMDGLRSEGDLRNALEEAQLQIQRGVKEAFVIDGAGQIQLRGNRSYLFDYEEPPKSAIERAAAGEIVLLPDWENDELRALMLLDGYLDRYLYISRIVAGNILLLLDDTEETALLYQQRERERGRLLFDFALLYLAFAVLLIMAAVWMGLWFAERLARPIGGLASAAQQVGKGDLDVQVPLDKGDDEIALLGRYFNRMTRQLKQQRDRLLENTEQIEQRRRLFDSVLSSVTSGVIGLDAKGAISFANNFAFRLLDWQKDMHAFDIVDAVPEFSQMFARLHAGQDEEGQGEVRMTRQGREEILLVRMATRFGAAQRPEGYVIAFDKVTDLVTAQRMAAWGDVARRIAHEIKNPLTPIQLSAERIQRKYSAALPDKAAELEQMTNVIIRQTNDLRRIVDEFSQFARMPTPKMRSEDVVAILRDAAILQKSGCPDITFTLSLPDSPILINCDATMLSQAFINLIKNACEAIEARQAKFEDQTWQPELAISYVVDDKSLEIIINDNGIGLPSDVSKLFEPYVTTREKGTGLGLPIVKKIIEEHSGSLQLQPNLARVEGGRGFGASALIKLPLL